MPTRSIFSCGALLAGSDGALLEGALPDGALLPAAGPGEALHAANPDRARTNASIIKTILFISKLPLHI
jgi:hypothetical protein